MKRFLVGLKCYQKWSGCECTIDTPEELKLKHEIKTGYPYDDYCEYIIVEAESAQEITLDMCLMQQGATEYETAKEIWTSFEVIEPAHLADDQTIEDLILPKNTELIYEDSDQVLRELRNIETDVDKLADLVAGNKEAVELVEKIVYAIETARDKAYHTRRIAWAYTEIEELPKDGLD